LRGTGPSLTQTLINGHNVASGDCSSQSDGTVGRSVSYTLLPSELSADRGDKSSKAELVKAGWQVRQHHHAQAP